MGTQKRGGASAPHVTTVFSFTNPAGRQLKFLTLRDQEISGERAQKEIHGDGSTAPLAIAVGEGKGTYKASITTEEWSLYAGVCKAGGIEITEAKFDVVQTTKAPGMNKITNKVTGASIAKFGDKVSGDGNRVEFEGACTQIERDGVKAWKEAE